MRRPPVSKKTEGFTKATTIWMRPELAKQLKVLAAQEETTVQMIVDEAVNRHINSRKSRREPAHA